MGKEITREIAVTLDKFSVVYNKKYYSFIKNSDNRYWIIYNKEGSRAGMYYKDDILRNTSFKFFIPKNSNAINY